MRHPTDGILRRLLDEPAGVSDPDRLHIADCRTCLTRLAAVRADAERIGSALDVATQPDVDAAWARLSQEGRPRQITEPARSSRWRTIVRSPVVAVVGVLALLGGASAAAAADWFPIFRTERIQPVTLNQSDLVGMPDLSAYGEVEVIQKPRFRVVPDAAAAKEATGLTLPTVATFPRGVTGEPAIHVTDKVVVSFRFLKARAERTAKQAGQPLPPPPPGLDGSEFRLTAGPAAAAMWNEGQGVPALIVARAVAPTAYSTGVSFTTAAGYLLTVPGLPANVATALRGLSGDGTTLPLPVNSQYLRATTADVNGSRATVLTSRDEVISAVVWVRGGQVTAVAGSLESSEALSVARRLR